MLFAAPHRWHSILARFLPFYSYYILQGSISPIAIFFVLAVFSLLILRIVVAMVRRSDARASLALAVLVSLTATLASSSYTRAFNYGSICRPGVLSRGFPFPWDVHPIYSPGQFGFVTTGCPVPREQALLVNFTPIFFALDTVFYFAGYLALSRLFTGLLKPVIFRLRRVKSRTFSFD